MNAKEKFIEILKTSHKYFKADMDSLNLEDNVDVIIKHNKAFMKFVENNLDTIDEYQIILDRMDRKTILNSEDEPECVMVFKASFESYHFVKEDIKIRKDMKEGSKLYSEYLNGFEVIEFEDKTPNQYYGIEWSRKRNAQVQLYSDITLKRNAQLKIITLINGDEPIRVNVYGQTYHDGYIDVNEYRMAVEYYDLIPKYQPSFFTKLTCKPAPISSDGTYVFKVHKEVYGYVTHANLNLKYVSTDTELATLQSKLILKKKEFKC